MLYEIEIHYADGTTEVDLVEASNPASAVITAQSDPMVVRAEWTGLSIEGEAVA